MSDNVNLDAVERNQARADCAEVAIAAYAVVKEVNSTDMYDFASQCPQERLTDLLADLRHWACQHGLDFEQSLTSSESHFNCESDEETETEELETEAAGKGGAA